MELVEGLLVISLRAFCNALLLFTRGSLNSSHYPFFNSSSSWSCSVKFKNLGLGSEVDRCGVSATGTCSKHVSSMVIL
nr:hypothetical protein [Tanacetum cinerariifolium]